MISYAIGDIHGCADELEQLIELIIQDYHSRYSCLASQIVFLGDYVDRGPKSKNVLDILCRLKSHGTNGLFPFKWGPITEDNHRGIIALPGNHEEAFLNFIHHIQSGDALGQDEIDWVKHYGGLTTLQSYACNDHDHPIHDNEKQMDADVWANIVDHIPLQHIKLLEEMNWSTGSHYIDQRMNLLFCHAGVVMDKTLDEQNDDDFLWSRDANFLEDKDADWCEPYTVIHGHTPATKPMIRNRRIGIDTACYSTGILTAVRMVCQESKGFLQTNAVISQPQHQNDLELVE